MYEILYRNENVGFEKFHEMRTAERAEGKRNEAFPTDTTALFNRYPFTRGMAISGSTILRDYAEFLEMGDGTETPEKTADVFSEAVKEVNHN